MIIGMHSNRKTQVVAKQGNCNIPGKLWYVVHHTANPTDLRCEGVTYRVLLLGLVGCRRQVKMVEVMLENVQQYF